MKTIFLGKENIAEGTTSFRIKKPEGYQYKAGQFIDLTLLNPAETDEKGNTRAFSIASAPHEDDIILAARMGESAFKRSLQNIKPGTELEISEPMGSFTMHKDVSKSAALLMGGIGVVPGRSMLLDAAEKQLPHQMYLFYSNRRPEDAAFLEELEALQKKNPNYKLIAVMTQPDKSSQGWGGETGRINAEMIKRHLPAPEKAVWYVAGPQMMVKAMRDVLSSLNADEDYVKTEEFSGY